MTMKHSKKRAEMKAAAPENYQARPTEEQIAARARAIYEASGCQPGHDRENWMQAEAELLRECQRQAGAGSPAAG